jgi:hypothetical protein
MQATQKITKVLSNGNGFIKDLSSSAKYSVGQWESSVQFNFFKFYNIFYYN